MKSWLLGLLGVMVLGSAAVFGYFHHWLNSPLDLPQGGLEYRLEQGRTLSHISRALAGEQRLEHPRLLRLYALLQGSPAIHAGDYKLEPGTTPKSLFWQLVEGRVRLYQVTIIEGWTYAQALEALHAQETIEPQLKGLSQTEQLERLALDIEHPEGWFFPDSYRYVRGTSDVEILRQAHHKMRTTLNQLWERRAPGLIYGTLYEALIMASIVERETGAPWEREAIAGVFVRRLEKGMRLQTDPTVIYGMGDDYQGRITRRDLLEPSPYNTYRIDGLPPTPIALPGREAIAAALNPAQGSSLYFVAKGDGTHIFSDTLEEHNRAVRDYQKRRRDDYRSFPPSQKPE